MTLVNGDLKDIYVLRETGECVFHENYSDTDKIETDEAVLSGFLSAIETFSSNVDNGTKMLETNNFRFIYHRENEYLYVARTAKEMNPSYVSTKLNSISSDFKKWIPKRWDGSVGVFQGIGDLVLQHFDASELGQIYEITGKDSQDLNGIEEKIYSFLRFRGRSQLSTIAKLMRIPESDVTQVAENLTYNEYLSSCS